MEVIGTDSARLLLLHQRLENIINIIYKLYYRRNYMKNLQAGLGHGGVHETIISYLGHSSLPGTTGASKGALRDKQ